MTWLRFHSGWLKLICVFLAVSFAPFELFAQTAQAPSLAQQNDAALAAFNAGDTQQALALTRAAIAQGQDLGQTQPQAYQTALNNLVLLHLMGIGNGANPLGDAQNAASFSQHPMLQTSELRLTALINLARTASQHEARDVARDARRALLSAARGTPHEGQILGLSVDLAFANEDFADLAPLMETMLQSAGRYTAQTDGTLLYDMQNLKEAEGDTDAALSLIDARLVHAQAVMPQQIDQMRAALLPGKFFLNYNAERFGAAAQALRAWADLDAFSPDEAAFIEDQAEASLTLLRLGGYGARAGLQLGFADLVVTYALIAYDQNDARIGFALRERAAAEARLGQYARAQASLQQALSILQHSENGRAEIFLVLEDLATNAWQRGDSALAERMFAAADTAAAQTGPAKDTLGPYDTSVLLLNRARVALELEHYAQAQSYLAAAQTAFDRFAASGTAKRFDLRHAVSLAEARARLAAAQTPNTAKPVIEAMIALAAQQYDSPHPDHARLLLNAADQLFALGHPIAGRAALERAETALGPSTSAYQPLHTELYNKRAIDALTMGAREQAIKALRHVTKARKSWIYRAELASASNAFEQLVWSLLSPPHQPSTADINEAVEALQWTFVTRSAEALAQMQARLSAPSAQGAALIKQRQNIESELAFSRSHLLSAYAQGDPPAPVLTRQTDLQAALDDINTQLQDAGLDLTGQAPLIPVSLQDLQSALRPKETIVTFVLPSLSPDAIRGLDGSSNLAIAITAKDVTIAPVGEISRGALRARIAALRCEMAISDTGCATHGAGTLRGAMLGPSPERATPAFDFDVAHRLYEDLFGGLPEVMAQTEHLVLVPPGDLLNLPFAALITRAQTDPTLGTAAWMIRAHAISVLPSLTAFDVLRAQDSRTTRPARRFLGVGDPRIGTGGDIACDDLTLAALRSATGATAAMQAGQSSSGIRLADPEALRALSRLPDSACELAQIGAGFDAHDKRILVQEDATEAAIKTLSETGQLADFDIIVFATHGLITGETAAAAPGLVLTPPIQATARNDGLLTSAEVAILSLDADLVILSACNTGSGEGGNGEGLSGLASGFFHAGARALLVTHWAVYSRASAEISANVARQVRRTPDMIKAEALRRATLAILNDPARPAFDLHPAYWAAFTSVGL